MDKQIAKERIKLAINKIKENAENDLDFARRVAQSGRYSEAYERSFRATNFSEVASWLEIQFKDILD